MKRIGTKSTSNWAARIERLGYSLFIGGVDSFGREWSYSVYPNSSGGIARFATLGDMATWVRQVEAIRNIDNICKAIEYGAPMGTLAGVLLTKTV